MSHPRPRLGSYGMLSLLPGRVGCTWTHQSSNYISRVVGGRRQQSHETSSLMHLHGGAGIKFVMYKNDAAHPIFGDETRKVEDAREAQGNMEWHPAQAVVALRHPQVCGAKLEDVRQAYASKLRIGGPAVIVDDDEHVFEHVHVLDDFGTMMSVRTRKYSQGVEAGDRILKVPTKQVFGGWHAHVAELTCPVHMLAKDMEFLWPGPVHQVVEVKRAGTPVDPDTGFGELLRAPHDLHITVNSIDYPLELDILASKASKKAFKHANRQRLFQILYSEMQYLIKVWPLLVFWFAVECRMYLMPPEANQHQELPREKQPKGEVQMNGSDFSDFADDFFATGEQDFCQSSSYAETAFNDEGWFALQSDFQALNLQDWGEIEWCANHGYKSPCEDLEDANERNTI